MFGKKWILLLAGACVVLAGLLQVPHVLRQIDPRYQGLMGELNSDADFYFARIQEALSGRGEQVAEAFVGDTRLVGTQFGRLERFEGEIFRLFGVTRAQTAVQVMASVASPLLLLLIVAFFMLAGFPRHLAFAGAILFCVMEIAGLNRPVHQRDSFLLVMLCLTLLSMGVLRHWVWGVFGGVLLGLLVGIYFWSFTFAWTFFGIWMLWEAVEWVVARWRRSKTSPKHLQRLLLFGLIGVIFALPFVLELFSIVKHPLYEFARYRSGMRPSHLPESIPYAILFLTMVGGMLLALREKYAALRSYRPAMVMAFTAFVVIHQQAVHGVIFNFVSHYIFALIVAAIGVVFLAIRKRGVWLLLSAAAACVYLAAVGYDGAVLRNQWTVKASEFREQHLMTAIREMEAMPRMRILSDPETSMIIAGNTKHDIVYSIYLKNMLITHDEIAERLCLTQLPLKPEMRNIAARKLLVYPDAIGAFKRADPGIRDREVQTVEEACKRVDRDPVKYVKQYGAAAVLWNEKQQPQWDIKRLRIATKNIARGDGWSLWSITTGRP